MFQPAIEDLRRNSSTDRGGFKLSGSVMRFSCLAWSVLSGTFSFFFCLVLNRKSLSVRPQLSSPDVPEEPEGISFLDQLNFSSDELSRTYNGSFSLAELSISLDDGGFLLDELSISLDQLGRTDSGSSTLDVGSFSCSVLNRK